MEKTTRYTKGQFEYIVPAGVTSIQIDAAGAQGGSSNGNTGGKGATAGGFLAVSPGQILFLFVGGAGTTDTGHSNKGYNGGGNGFCGGGGASDVRMGGIALENRILVAAGGGGASRGPGNQNGGDGGGNAGTLGVGADGFEGGGGGGGGFYGGGSVINGNCGSPGDGGSSYYGGNGITNGYTTPGVKTGDGYIEITAAATLIPGTIYAIAGNGMTGNSGDGGAAINAEFEAASDVFPGVSGNLYIADTVNHVVRKVTPAGIITTFAGNGTSGFSGDGGVATEAQLYYPYRITEDTAGNIYISDTNNHRVRKVSPAGIITTFAGGGFPGFSGAGGLATMANLTPRGIAVDTAGNFYIGDASYRICKVTPDGMINVFAGNGTYGHSGDGGPATAAEISGAEIAVDASGNVYIAENNFIRKVTPDGVITTIAGNGTLGNEGDGGLATSASISVNGLASDASGNIYIFNDAIIRKVTTSGNIYHFAGDGTQGTTGDVGPATSAKFESITGIGVDASGNVYISDLNNARIRMVVGGA